MRKSPYHMIGGEAAVERLGKTFYDIVESDPAGASRMAMHNWGHGLAHAREAQRQFGILQFYDPKLIWLKARKLFVAQTFPVWSREPVDEQECATKKR